MKALFSYFILLSFVLQIGSRIYVLVDFKINQEYIAENLCEKKDEPESCCEGKCHLAEELNEIEEAESNTPINADNSKKEKIEDFPLFLNSSQVLIQPTNIFQLNFSYPTSKTTSGFSNDLFHPPCC